MRKEQQSCAFPPKLCRKDRVWAGLHMGRHAPSLCWQQVNCGQESQRSGACLCRTLHWSVFGQDIVFALGCVARTEVVGQ